jgi:hypothetical protein
MDLAAFKRSVDGGGSDDRKSMRPELVDHPGDQRSFGSDDGEVDIETLGEIDIIHRRLTRRAALANVSDARIPRCGEDFRDGRAVAQLPCHGMLAAAAANDQCFHRLQC